MTTEQAQQEISELEPKVRELWNESEILRQKRGTIENERNAVIAKWHPLKVRIDALKQYLAVSCESKAATNINDQNELVTASI